MNSTNGKLSDRDEMIANAWKWLPWLSFFLLALPGPITFFIFFLVSTATDTAAFYLILSGLSLGLGAGLGLICVLVLLFFRRRWFQKLRDRLAEDGITADEVVWFNPELTSAERETLREIQQHNPLLADAYSETLASRLTATRILSRVRREKLRVERRMNIARSLSGRDKETLLNDLQADHQKLESLKAEASSRLSEAKTRLQMIDAAASRNLNQRETDLMLSRLAESQSHLPIAMEMATLEQRLLHEAQLEVTPRTSEPPALQ